MIQIGAAQNAIIHVDVLPRRQQAHKRAPQRTAVSPMDMTAAMLLDVCFYFLCFLKHGRKLCVFRLIKAVIADAEYSKILFQQRNDSPKIAFPMAAGSGQQQKRRGAFIFQLPLSICFLLFLRYHPIRHRRRIGRWDHGLFSERGSKAHFCVQKQSPYCPSSLCVRL